MPRGLCSLQNRKWSIFFSKGVPTGHTYSRCWEGKASGTTGHSAMFFLERTLGQRNCAIHFKEPPAGGSGVGKTGKRQSRGVQAQTRLSITALTQWRQEQSQKTSSTTETLRGSENKQPSIDMKYCPVLCLQIITHFYYLHISWSCFLCRMTNKSNGTLAKWRLILETPVRWIVRLTLLDFVPTVINGSWMAHKCVLSHGAAHPAGELKVELVAVLLIGEVVNATVYSWEVKCAAEAIFLFTVCCEDIYTRPDGNFINQRFYWFPLHSTARANVWFNKENGVISFINSSKGQQWCLLCVQRCPLSGMFHACVSQVILFNFNTLTFILMQHIKMLTMINQIFVTFHFLRMTVFIKRLYSNGERQKYDDHLRKCRFSMI